MNTNVIKQQLSAIIAVKDDVKQVCYETDILFKILFVECPVPSSYVNFSTWKLTKRERMDLEESFSHYVYEMNAIMDMWNIGSTESWMNVLDNLDTRVTKVILPVVILRYLLVVHHCALDPDVMTTFDEFHDRYGYLICNSCYLPRKPS